MSGHTQGRLVCDPDGVGALGSVGTTDGLGVAQTQAYFPGKAGNEQRERDARRIVACWNATADIPVEALETGVVAKLVDLLEGAGEIIDDQLGGDFPDTMREIRHALALAKGEAA